MKKILLLALFALFYPMAAISVDDTAPVLKQDPHRNELGFFDIHICNWPSRPLFFKALFATKKFKDIKSMEVYDQNKKKLVDLSLQRFKLIKLKDKSEKRVYMMDIDVPPSSQNGWYEIVVKTKDGKSYTAKDYVVMNRIGQPVNMIPADETEDIKLPEKLEWEKVPGATHYKVFIRDGFESTLVFKSKTIQKPFIKLQPGLLKPGGYYTWIVHARDVNENVFLGDFNAGSISKRYSFSVAD